jgi:hypothetical protein
MLAKNVRLSCAAPFIGAIENAHATIGAADFK